MAARMLHTQLILADIESHKNQPCSNALLLTFPTLPSLLILQPSSQSLSLTFDRSIALLLCTVATMLALSLILLLSLVLAFTSADEFTYPPKFGAIGEYVSNLNFTVGERVTLEWEAEGTNDLSLWLVQDVGGEQCTFQSNAMCARIASKQSSAKVFSYQYGGN